MKHKVFYILVYLLLSSFLSNSQIVFDTIIGNSDIHNGIHFVTRIPNNSYLMSAYQGTDVNSESSFFTCNEYGLIQNKNIIPKYNPLLIINKIIKKNDEYLLLGATGKTNYNEICLYSYDNDFDFQWYKEFCLFGADSTISYLKDYAVNRDDEIIIMGSDYRKDDGGSRRALFAFKTNFNGDSLFLKKHYSGINSDFKTFVYTIDTIPNENKYLIAGNEFIDEDHSMSCDVLKIDNNLNIETIFTPIPENNYPYDSFWGNSQIKFYSDTSFLSASRKIIYGTSRQEEEVCVQHYNTSSELLKETCWGADGNSMDYFSYWGIDFIEKSAIYVGGTSPISSPNNYMMLTKLDENLDILWTKFYGGNANYNLFHVIASEDGGCLMVGDYFYSDTMSYRNNIIVKLDADGNTSLSTTGIKNNSGNLMKDVIVYPNPTKGIINIRKGQQIKNSIVKIYDLKGKLINETQLLSNISEVNLTGNKSGTYIYEIISNNKVIYKDKIILIK